MIRVRGDRVIVKMPKIEEKTDTGIWIPVREQEPPMEGIVMSVGNGDRVKDLKAGDRVVFEQWAGLEIEDDDWGDALLLEYDDLMMVVDGL